MDHGAAGACIETETDFLGRSTAELKNIVLLCEKSSREASHTLLAGVESIPNVVHHGVEGVVKASFLVQ